MNWWKFGILCAGMVGVNVALLGIAAPEMISADDSLLVVGGIVLVAVTLGADARFAEIWARKIMREAGK